MKTASLITIWVGIVGLALVAGLFWGWAVSAMPGLRKVDDRTYVDAMQSINRAILNPIFLVVFTGTVLALIAASVTTFLAGHTRRGMWITAATVVYVMGVFGVTVAGNVPLNDELDAFAAAGAGDQAYAQARDDYEGPWNRLHVVRSVLGVVAIGLAAVAALTPVDD